jgi:hypothetical protein
MLIGASRPEQVTSNIAVLEVTLNPPQQRRLEQASASHTTYPLALFTPVMKRFVFGGHEVTPWR